MIKIKIRYLKWKNWGRVLVKDSKIKDNFCLWEGNSLGGENHFKLSENRLKNCRKHSDSSYICDHLLNFDI